MDFTPLWILKKVVDEEITCNWKDTYIAVSEHHVLQNVNFITYHSLYKAESEEEKNV